MARSHARVKVEAWEPGSDFRALSLPAQWAYVMLISQPEINNCGVLPYRPERWLEFADGLTSRTLNRALRELADQRFVVVDERTRELLVRTFVKHDRIEAQPNLKTSAQRQYREVESPTIRAALEAQYPDLFACGNPAAGDAFAPRSDRPLSSTPGEDDSARYVPDRVATDSRHLHATKDTASRTVAAGSEQQNGSKPASLSHRDPEPLPEGVREGVNARARTAPAAGPLPHPPLSSQDDAARDQPADPESEKQDTSAAAEAAPTDTDILEACRRFGADRDIVFPIAEQRSAHTLAQVVAKVERKIKRGSVDDVPALFVHVLQRAPRLPHPDEPQPLAPPPPEPIERVDRDTAVELNVRRLVENGRDWPTIQTFIHDAFGDDLLDLAASVYDDAHSEPRPVT